MKIFAYTLFILFVGIKVYSQQPFITKTKICGSIKNPVENKEVFLVRDYTFLPKESYHVLPDENGNFCFEIQLHQLIIYWLQYNKAHGIPLFLESGDSVHVNFDASNQLKFPEYLQFVKFSGKGELKNRSSYSIYKHVLQFQDSIFFKYINLNPNSFKNYCLKQMNAEKQRLTKVLNDLNLNKRQKRLYLVNNEFFWFNMLFQYSFKPQKEYIGKTNEYINYLENLGYYNFFEPSRIKYKDAIGSSNFDMLIMHYYSYFHASRNEYQNLKNDVEKLDYIRTTVEGDMKDLLSAFYINRFTKTKSKEEYNRLVNTYISNSDIKTRLIK